MKKLIYNIYVCILKFLDSNDGKLIRKFYKKIYNIEIGKYTYGYNIKNIGQGTKLGAFCSIAPDVKIGLMNHPKNYVSTNPFLYYSSRGFIYKDKNIRCKIGSIIENDVWIGCNAVILPGVHIRNGAIIGAGAVVTKDVEPYEIVGGVPARHIAYRFEDVYIRNKMNEIDWYNWSDEKIKKYISLFYNPEEFIKIEE